MLTYPFMISIEVQAVAVLPGPLPADKVNVIPLPLETLPYPRTPAAIVGDGIAQWHPPHRCRLRRRGKTYGNQYRYERETHVGIVLLSTKSIMSTQLW